MPRTSAKPVAAASPREKLIRDPGFARRIEQAADQHPHCPAKHHGRLVWVVEQMKTKGVTVSNETVRKWFEGEATPRQDKAHALGEIFGVDAAWLQMGIDAKAKPRERKVRNAMAEGVVNLLAGMIEMDGGHPAFPEENDTRATREHIDLYSIIKGASYALHVALAETEGKKISFTVPSDVGENVIVIVVVRDGLAFDLFEAAPEEIDEFGSRTGPTTTVTIEGSKLKKIEGFTRRL